MDPTPSAPRTRSLPSQCAGAAVGLIGVVVFAGWVFSVPALRGPLPGLVAMKANTALAFICTGISLWLLANPARGRARIAAVPLAAVAVIIGALTLAEYVLGRNLGIDELLFRDPNAVHTVHAGRLAPQSAVNFILLGLALMNIGKRRPVAQAVAQVAALIALGTALFALLGYAYGVDGFNTVPAFTPIALHSAIAFAVLAVGVACADPSGFVRTLLTSPHAGSVMARRVLPATFVVLPVVGWIRLNAQEAGLFGTALGVALMVVAGLSTVTVAVAITARRLNRADAALRSHSANATARLSAVEASSPDAILTSDARGVLTRWNPAAEQIFGYTADEAIGSPVDMLCPPSHQGEARTFVDGALNARTIADFETTRVRKDGREIHVSISASPLRDGDGLIVGASAIVRDITARKRAEADLRIALTHVRQAKADVEASHAETVHRLTRAVEHRDDETGAHVERMSRYCGLIAQKLGLSDEICSLIETASPMHDVGKIAVPDAILFKPGPLTPAERATIELHPEAGYRILAGSSSELLQMAATIARSHHERFDGTGYPHGLEGEQIPLAGRIAAVADVYDALTSNRVYRAALPLNEALTIMRNGRGTHFDPHVLDAFLELIHEQHANTIEPNWNGLLAEAQSRTMT